MRRSLPGVIFILGVVVLAVWIGRIVKLPEINLSSIKKADITKVIRVIDGDTIETEDGETVRYIGINTPESKDPRKGVECFGREASDFNKKLVEGAEVRLEKDVSNKDKYGRLLRYVWLGDRLLNEELVDKGYAQVATYPPDVKYKDRLLKAEANARLNLLGLWNKCK